MNFLAKALIGVAIPWIIIVVTGGIHKIEEGFVGVYYIGGVLS